MAREERNDDGAQLFIYKAVFDQLVKKHKRFKDDAHRWDYLNEQRKPLGLPIRGFSKQEFKDLRAILEEFGSTYRGTIAQIDYHLDAEKNPDKHVLRKLVTLESALIAFVKKNIIEGWLFEINRETGALRPYLVQSVRYQPAYRKENTFIPARVWLQCTHWSKGDDHTRYFQWYASDVLGKTVGDVLGLKNLVHETKSMVEDYNKDEKTFFTIRKQLGIQYLCSGVFETKDKDSSWRTTEKQILNNRAVVNDRCDDITEHEGTTIFIDIRREEFGEDYDEDDIEENKHTRQPNWHYVWCFSLETHEEGWVHIHSMKRYIYRPELKSNLILDVDHESLIDALTADVDALMEDIVSGKSGGTTIVCKGKPGTGKTLTAEVYAEVVGKPLYRIHSGQLGTDAETVERELTDCLKRAKAWGAVMLIDEADVFMMSRGESLERNAVVAVFLRTLEYFDGLIFLTTNRSDEIDDAILSRAIAVISFKMPQLEERKRLWKSLGEVYRLKMIKQPGMIDKLASTFEVSGRDIKGLIRLTIKACRKKKIEPDFATMKKLSVFKGIELTKSKAAS